MPKLRKPVLVLDGRSYHVSVTKLKRKGEIIDGPNAGRVMSAVMKRDVLGTFYNYEITFGTSLLSPSDYDALYEILTAPVDSHTITVPYGQGIKTFEVYITSASDELARMKDDVNMWSSLTIDFIAMEPARRP